MEAIEFYRQFIPKHENDVIFTIDMASDIANQYVDHLIQEGHLIKSKANVSRSDFFVGGRELWQEHHRSDSERLQKLLIAKGFTSCSIGEAEGLWMEYSDGYAAGFLGMPDDDNDLYECIKNQLCVVERKNIG